MRLSEVSRSEIWGFFAGKSQIIAVIRPEPLGESPQDAVRAEGERVKMALRVGT